MPSGRKEFESGELDPSLLLIEFLRSNPDCYYILEELIVELASRGINVKTEEMQDILQSLEKQDKVEAKTRTGVVYYIYQKLSLGFRAPGR